MDLILSSKYKDFLKKPLSGRISGGNNVCRENNSRHIQVHADGSGKPPEAAYHIRLGHWNHRKEHHQQRPGNKRYFRRFGGISPSRERRKPVCPHLLFHTSGGEKTIYILGYDNKSRWKKALGGSMDAYTSTRSTLRTWNMSENLLCGAII